MAKSVGEWHLALPVFCFFPQSPLASFYRSPSLQLRCLPKVCCPLKPLQFFEALCLSLHLDPCCRPCGHPQR